MDFSGFLTGGAQVNLASHFALVAGTRTLDVLTERTHWSSEQTHWSSEQTQSCCLCELEHAMES